jgi:hypothetical protein
MKVNWFLVFIIMCVIVPLFVEIVKLISSIPILVLIVLLILALLLVIKYRENIYDFFVYDFVYFLEDFFTHTDDNKELQPTKKETHSVQLRSDQKQKEEQILRDLKNNVNIQLNEKWSTFKKTHLNYIYGNPSLDSISDKFNTARNYYYKGNYDETFSQVGGLLSELSSHFINAYNKNIIKEDEYWTSYLELCSFLSLVYGKTIINLELVSKEQFKKAGENAILAVKLTDHLDNDFVNECEAIFNYCKQYQKTDSNASIYEYCKKDSNFTNKLEAFSRSIKNDYTPCHIYNKNIKLV